MSKLMRKRTISLSFIIVLSLALVASSFTAPKISFGDTTVGSEAVTLDNTGEGEDAISLTQERSFIAKVKVDMTREQLEKAIEDKTIRWNLSRKKGMQDPGEFPYQYLGGPMDEWKTVATTVESGGQEEIDMFQNITNSVVTEGDALYLQMEFDSKTLFGYNGIDNRDRVLVRNTILDYTGRYDLTCYHGKSALGSTSVWVRPYDSFHTQSQVDEKLAELAARANAAGLYAKIEAIGYSVKGRPINALFLSAKSSDLSNHLAQTERAETNPTQVKKEVAAGTLDYKVPVVYSNIHSDEIIGADGCLDFVEAVVEAAEGSGKIPYNKITGLTSTGKATLQAEMSKDGKVWSELIKDKVTGVGFIQGEGKFEPSNPKHTSDAVTNMTDEQMKKYYNISKKDLDIDEILTDMFFIVVPSENVDGRQAMTRTNANYFDLNRDNSYQTQPETQAMTQLIAKWNPITLYEIHGYYDEFVVEPCTPAHEPNAEYDLYIDTSIEQGENFGAAAIANNESINSFQLTLRDYLSVDNSGKKKWGAWEDISPSYTPIYAFLHGCNAYTAEFPYGSHDAQQAVKYGLIGNADFVAENKDRMYLNQLEFFRRGLENIDADTISPYFVSQYDDIGAEADKFRKKYEENNNFFPEYYIIPISTSDQKNIQAAKEMAEYLLRNDVKLKQLTKDVTIHGKTYKKGSLVVDMHQAKRNMANSALYSNMVIDTWDALYSEPLTAFPQLRGFDAHVITKVGAIKAADTKKITKVPSIKTTTSGSGSYMVLSNNSVDAIQAVNRLLKNGKTVGMITSGTNKGDFLVKKTDFNMVKNDYILVGKAVSKMPAAKAVKKAAKVYIPGRTSSAFTTTKNGREYGIKRYQDRLNTALGWDIFAFEQQMGFQVVDNPENADVIVGSRPLGEKELDLIKKGKPYIGYTVNALKAAKDLGIDIDYQTGGSYDALTTVTYESDNLITAKYKQQKDNIMYGYGGNYITQAPKGAEILIKTTSDYPIEGFMAADYIEKYKGTIQAIDYKQGGCQITLFANTMTNKAHQLDDYRYLSNAIYSKMLASTFKDIETIDGIKKTKITAKSALTKNGIKVSWKKSAGYKVDYYEVFRSMKKSSGYGTKAYYKTKTNKTFSFIDSKKLKKGTRYYYKVRGVRIIDKTKYYTSWSNKANRTAK